MTAQAHAAYAEHKLGDTALESFKRVTKGYALFHIFFFFIAVTELISFILFFSFLTQTAIFAFSLAGLFFTGFAYFVILFYFQAKKPQQLLEIKERFIQACAQNSSSPKDSTQYYLEIAAALQHLLITLHRQEYSYYAVPTTFETLSPLMQKFSVWTHWKDLLEMKELLLLTIIHIRIELIKMEPTDLELHAHLADAYLALSRLYMDPRKLYPNEDHLFVSPEYLSSAMVHKFKKAALKAIEEYKILDAYAPNDPWIHLQLASIYQDLERKEEEMHEYEMILQLLPQNGQALFRLGVLYFEQGRSAQALRLYETLKKYHSSKADELISYYGSGF